MSLSDRKELHTDISRLIGQLKDSIKDVSYEIQRIDEDEIKTYEDELNLMKQHLYELEQETETLK